MSGEQKPSKVSGQFHSVKGTAEETLGNLMGNQSMQQQGKEEHTRGEAEYKSAQMEGYAEGAQDRVGGYKDSVVGAVTGDKSQQTSGNARKEKGQTEQKINKPSFD